MDVFRHAKAVKLKSHRGKYLTADANGETVSQQGSESSPAAVWALEFANGRLRLQSCFGKYLTALDEDLAMCLAGKRVGQTLPRKMDSGVEWEPIRDGLLVRLKSRYGKFLRANGGLTPCRNAIAHDAATSLNQEWSLWEVEIVDIRDESDEFDLDSLKVEEIGRNIYYSVVTTSEEDLNPESEKNSFRFKGNRVEELVRELEKRTGYSDIRLYFRHGGKLHPLRLDLPPNNADMHVVVVAVAAV